MVKVKRVAEPHPPPYYDLDVLFLLADKSNFPTDLTADQAFRRGNILGTVTQSGGTPTGALIETGSNANGEYARLANGLQVCWATLASLSANSAIGSLFRTGADSTWTYPSAFSATPFVSITGNAGGTWGVFSAVSLTSVLYRRMSALSDAGTIPLYGLAVGRWF